MKSELIQGFYLGDVLVRPTRGEVSGTAFSAHLTPKATEVLLSLASRPGELVSREELLREGWGEGKGTPEALSHAISDIRHALRDSAAAPHVIQTIPRRGYRLLPTPVPASDPAASIVLGGSPGSDRFGFLESLVQRGVIEAGLAYLILGWLLIQVVDVVFEQLLFPQWAGTFVTILVIAGFPIVLLLSWFLEFRDGRAVVDKGPISRTPRQRFSRTYLSVLCALCVASVLVYTYDQMVGLPVSLESAQMAAPIPGNLPPVDANSIAVLPFMNIDGSEQTELFAAGFAEDVINRLALIPGLAVAARGDCWSLGPSASSGEIRRRLRVARYVEGSVRQSGDTIDVNVKLVDSGSGFPIITRQFRAPLDDFNRVRHELTDVMLANLKVTLPQKTQSVLDSIRDETALDAYILYRRGREAYERPQSIDSLSEAADHYRQALQFDAGYAAAHAGLCSAYVARYLLSSDAADIERAKQACAAALKSNPRLHVVYAALGDLNLNTGRMHDAREAYLEALEINAHDVRAMAGLAEVYRLSERFADAEALLIEATQVQPGNWRALNNLGAFLFSMGRFDEAADAFKQVVAIDPDNFQARGNLGSALTMAGDFEQGRRVLEQSLALRPDQLSYSNLGVIYYFLGEFERSVATHRRAVELASGQPLAWLNLADSLHFAGRIEESEAAFRKARSLAAATLEINPNDSESVFALAWAQHMLGNSDVALSSVERGLGLDSGDPYGYYYLALIRFQTGDVQEALDALATALDKGYPPGMLVAEPHLGKLRENDRFNALVAANR